MNQEWFEFRDLRRRELNNAVWVPLRAAQTISEIGEMGSLGYWQEFYGAASVAVALDQRAAAEAIDWSELSLMRGHQGFIRDGDYVPADVFENDNRTMVGLALLLSQDGNSDEPPEWHLHQDLVIALRLKREGDCWLAMDEGYVEVARLRRSSGRPVLMEIRAEYLKDYLCARGMALYVSSYRNREETVSDAQHIAWGAPLVRETADRDRWEGRLQHILEGGHPVGGSAAVMHVGREDIDFDVDVPTIGPTDENIVSRSWTIKYEGAVLVRIQGELWRTEWVLPGAYSSRVRRDELPPSAFFVIDAAGTRKSADDIAEDGRWLWFRPDVIMALAHRRGGALMWYTRDTGGVRCSPGPYTHFGVNKLGIVNAYAKDIANLREWEQEVWSGFNVGPEGGVSEELLSAQAAGNPASTDAPEALLPVRIGLLNAVTRERFGFDLFRGHEQIDDLLKTIHRFRALDRMTIFALAKDMAKVTVEDINTAALQKIAAPPRDTKWGSLKSLENVLALSAGAVEARALMGTLVGINELRNADAHLPSNDTAKAFALAGIDPSVPPVTQGYQILSSCVSTLLAIAKKLKR